MSQAPEDWDEEKNGRWLAYMAESEDGSMSHPEWFLRIEKEAGGTWVTTGWAPSLGAAKRHANAVGGKVRVSGHGSGVYVEFNEPLTMTDNVKSDAELCCVP